MCPRARSQERTLGSAPAGAAGRAGASTRNTDVDASRSRLGVRLRVSKIGRIPTVARKHKFFRTQAKVGVVLSGA